MAAKNFYTGIDLQQNELQNAVWHKLASAPSSPVAGQEYYNTTENKAYLYNGTEWIDVSTHTVSEVVVDNTYDTLAGFITNVYDPANFAEGDVLVLSTATDPEQRTWINLGTNVGDATDWTNLSVAYNETEIKAMFSASNGVNYSNGAFSADVDDSSIEVGGSGLQVKADGVNASMINADVAGNGLEPNATTGALDVKVDDSTIEISTDTLQVKAGGITETELATAVTDKLNTGYAETVGDGTATSFTITHNLGTTDVITAMYEIASGECVTCQVTRDSINQITVGAFPAPASNDLRILVQKLNI